MKSVSAMLVLAAIVSCALALPPPLGAPARAVLAPVKEGAREVQVVRFVNDANPDGSYSFGYETDNGIARDETGVLRTLKDEEGKDSVVVVQSGSYAYPGLDGRSYRVNYLADETGFHAEGEHIPKN